MDSKSSASPSPSSEEEVSLSQYQLKPSSSGTSSSTKSHSSSDFDSETPHESNGEEEFETAPGRPFADEGTLELAVKEEQIAHVVSEPVIGSSEFPLVMPELQISGSDGVAEPPMIGGLRDEEGREIGTDVKESMEIENGSSFEESSEVENPRDGVLDGKDPSLEKNSILSLVSVGLVGDGVDEVSEAYDEVFKCSKEDRLPENLKSDEDADFFAVRMEDKEATGFKDEDHIVKLTSIVGGASVVDAEQQTGEEQNVVSDFKEAGFPVEENAVLSGGSKHGSIAVVADKDENLEAEKNLADETKEQIYPVLAAGGCEELAEDQISETKPLGLEVERSVSLEIGTEKAHDIDEKSNYSKPIDVDNDISKVDGKSDATHFDSEQTVEPVTNSIVQESKTKVERAENDHDEMNGGSIDDIASTHPDINGQKPEVEREQQINLGGKLNGLVPKLATDGVEYGSNGAMDGVDEAQTVDSSFNLEKLNSVLNDKQEDEHQNNTEVHAAGGDDLSVAAQSDALEDDVNTGRGYKEDDEGSISDEESEGMHFEGSEISKNFMEKLGWEAGASALPGAKSSRDYSQRIDKQIVMESDEEVDTDEEGEGNELFDSAALTALLKAATSAGSEGGAVTITSSDGSRLFSLERPAGLGSSLQSIRPAPRPNRPNLFTPSDLMDGRELDDKLSDEEKKKLEKIQLIRVKFLRLINRVGHSPEDSIAAQVLYRLVVASGRHTSQAFSLEAAKTRAMQLEAESAAGKNDLDFSINILVLGKTGVGKSATINSIFGQEKAIVNAFEPTTTFVKEINGTVDGVKIRVFDTPGLRSSVMEQAFNQRILSSVKKLTKKCPPDILLYVDRLDTQTRDLNDLPLLRSITSTLGSSIWQNAIVTLTHAASAPPDGPSGSPLSYDVFVAQRSHIVQQSIGQAVGDIRSMNPSLMNPVSLVENHPSCRRNREGQSILPNGQSWRSQLLLLCYSLKILSEASSLSKPQDPFDHRKLFGFRVRSPPLPYLLSSLLQSRAHPKLPTDQGDNVESDIELEDLSDSDQEEEEDEYDQLPPFKPLRKSQIAKLSKDQRKAYFDEYDYRVKLLQKKQWKEELRRTKAMKKRGKSGADSPGFTTEDADQENEGPAAVPVPLPDMVMPPSFDGDNPAYRYRFLEPTSQFLARPVLDTHGWDHDCGYDGVSLEENLAIAGRFPAGIAVQITKDKKEFNVHMDSSVAAKHGENGSTLAGFDVQNIGKQLAYIVKAETKFKNLKKNKTAGGISITFLGENVVTGLKIEDQIAIGKRFMLVGSTGTVRSQGDTAYGANLEARLKENDYPFGQDQATLGLSLMRWRGDLALGANLQSQFSIGRSSKMSVRVGLNNKLSGQITVRTSSSEQLQLAVVGLLPIAMAIYRIIYPAAGESYSAY